MEKSWSRHAVETEKFLESEKRTLVWQGLGLISGRNEKHVTLGTGVIIECETMIFGGSPRRSRTGLVSDWSKVVGFNIYED